MKRVFIRISALAALAVMGTFAIAHAQRAAPLSRPLDDAVAVNNPQPSPINDPFTVPAPRAGAPINAAPADAMPAPATNILRATSDGTAASSRSSQFTGYSSYNRPVPESQYSSNQPLAEPRYSSDNRPVPESRSPGPSSSRPMPGPSVLATSSTNRPAAEPRRLLSTSNERTSVEPAYLPPATNSRPMVEARSVTGTIENRLATAGRPLSAASDARPSGVIAQVAEAGPRYGTTRSATGEPAPLVVDPAAAQMARARSGESLSPSTSSGMSARGTSSSGFAAADAGATTDASGQPGVRQLEGPQSPQMTIQKFAPEGLSVGKPAVFRVTVANRGAVAARGVEIHDLVPRGTQLIDTKPRAARGPTGEVVWELGTVKPGDEVTVEMHLMPVAEGEIGSVATVRFAADASARAVATRPELAIKVAAPPKVLIGEDALLSIVISNPGTGVATGVVLHERIPAGMQHPAGAELEYEIGNLKPGESRQLQLPLTAVRAGNINNLLVAKGEGNLRAEERTNLEVVAPRLDVVMEGPKRRYLERQATYTVSVTNPGTAPAKQVELVAYLPSGLKFVNANNAGRYEPATQTVHWLLEELPANDSGKVELTTMPIEAGEHKLRLMGKADKGLNVEKEQPVSVEGIAAVLFEVSDANNPIEVGGQTTYEIHVVNQGSKAATNVRITALLPAGLKFIAAEGPTHFSSDGGRVQFESLARLAPKADTSYRVRVQGIHPGDLRVRVQLLTDEMQEPVTKEESTRVYRDE